MIRRRAGNTTSLFKRQRMPIEKFAIAEACHVLCIMHLATKHLSSLSVSRYFSGGGARLQLLIA